MQIAQVLSGYTLGGADLLRRAMGKKIKEEMEAQRRAFIDGAVARGVNADNAAQIFDQVNKFAGYGFNKSHAAAYALVAYQTAWLKANYPVEFLAASMTYELANTDKLNVFRQELTRQGIALLPPDINKSFPTFSVERQADGSLAVRYALAAVKNVGLGAIQTMVKAREEGGPFRDLADFCERIDPKSLNKRQLENLVLAGAFDSIHSNRKQVFEAVEQMLRQAAAVTEARTSSQNSLFGDAAKAKVMLSTTLDWSPMERLQHEFGAIGFYLSAHPLDAYGASLKRLDVVPHADLGSWFRARGPRAKVAGLLLSKQEKTSAKGNRFAFLQLTDQSGMYEATIFSDRLQAAREHLEPGRALLLSVDIRAEDDNLRLMVNSVEPLDRAVANTAAGLRIFLREPGAVNSLQKVLATAGKGKGKIELALDVPDKAWEVAVTLPGRYAVSGAVPLDRGDRGRGRARRPGARVDRAGGPRRCARLLCRRGHDRLRRALCRAAGDPLAVRPRAGCDSREPAARLVPGLRRRALQTRRVRDLGGRYRPRRRAAGLPDLSRVGRFRLRRVLGRAAGHGGDRRHASRPRSDAGCAVLHPVPRAVLDLDLELAFVVRPRVRGLRALLSGRSGRHLCEAQAALAASSGGVCGDEPAQDL
jgi:hypothetical protein